MFYPEKELTTNVIETEYYMLLFTRKAFCVMNELVLLDSTIQPIIIRDEQKLTSVSYLHTYRNEEERCLSMMS